jgi:putative flippase GtrA
MEKYKKYTKLVRFLVSGGSAALVEYCTFLFLGSTFHINIFFANSLSFLCGLIVSFLLNKRWVFRSKKKTYGEFIRYFILALVNLAISNIAIDLLVNGVHLKQFIAKIYVMMIIALWNYIIFSKLIFHSAHELEEAIENS